MFISLILLNLKLLKNQAVLFDTKEDLKNQAVLFDTKEELAGLVW